MQARGLLATYETEAGPVLTISSGHSARYLTDAVATGRENYYTGAVADGEPPGRWYGSGAEQLGLTGLVDAQDMTALYERYLDPRDPQFRCPEAWDEVSTLGHTGRSYPSEDEIYDRLLAAEPHADASRRDELRFEASKSVRRNVSFLDATFSVQKSITVLHTAFEAQQTAAANAGHLDEAQAWGEARQAVEDAIWAGNNAGLDYLTEKAGFVRVGHHGGQAGRWVDAHDWTIASFFQHDSRDHDPQLHIHNAILNRVQGPDGAWRTLDGRSIYRWRGAAGAIAERVTEERLAHTLGIRLAMRPDGKAREIVDIPAEVNDLFSCRTRAITPKQAELIAEFEQRYGREPNRLEAFRLGKRATFLTRQAKSHVGQPRETWLEAWDTRLRAEITGGLAQLADQVMDQADGPRAPMTWSSVEVIETALAAVQAKKAAWTEADLIRELNNALPDTLGLPDGVDVTALMDRLGQEAIALAVALDTARPGEQELPDDLRRADGQSMYQAPGARLYATPEHVASEQLLVAATADQGAAALDPRTVAGFLDQLRDAGVELGADQATAVRGVLTSGARVESLIGPAGTGKSFVIGTLAKAWQDPEHGPGRVYGLATSQIAAGVLTDQGLTATNTARWLATQGRLADGRTRDGDEQWVLTERDIVVVDESSMADTAALAAVHARADAAGAKMLLVGDHHQLAAVGAGGALELLAEHGRSYELADARRFTHPWERTASLQLRAGDPAAIEAYHREGRIIDAGILAQAETAAANRWLADTLDGRQAVLLVDDNDQAARLNATLRADLVRLGHVTEEGVHLGRDDTTAGVGDVVAARRLAWELTGYRGNTAVPTTRQQYRVQQIHDDGSMTVAPILTAGATERLGEPIQLPASYVEKDLTLGYASTVHAAQGLTVDRGIEIVTAATQATALYPGATRGRDANTLFVVTQAAPSRDATTGEIAQAIRHDPRAVLARILDNTHTEQSATAEATTSAETMAQVRTAGELFADEAARVVTARTATLLDRLVDDGTITPQLRQRLAAEDAATSLGRVLRRAELAGHQPEAVLRHAVGEQELHTARLVSNVLRARITDRLHLDPRGATFADWTPATDNPAWDRYLTALAEHADHRRHELGNQALADLPTWALEALGPIPDDPTGREQWRERAATVAAHRELTGHTDDTTAIGAPPPAGQAEAYASWRAAWRALDRPDADRDEVQMSDGQLRMRMRAYQREQTWAPRHVANELAGTIQAAEHHRANATRWAAQAASSTDPDQRARLHDEAAGAAALTEILEGQIEALRGLDEQRATWLVHTAETRAQADRAQAELTARHAGDESPDEHVTAEEWMAADADATRDDDLYREVTETDLHDELTNIHTEVPARPEDLREIAAAEPAQDDEHLVRVPTAAETTDAIALARRAILEMRNRDQLDATHEADYTRAAQFARWHEDERSTEHERAAPALDAGDY